MNDKRVSLSVAISLVIIAILLWVLNNLGGSL